VDPSLPGETSDPQTWNFYNYVLSDPVNLNDPEGLNYEGIKLSRGPEDCSTRLIGWITGLTSAVPAVQREINKWKQDPATFIGSSDAGMLATHIFLEWQGDNTRPADDANIWRGLANVWRNRWKLSNSLKKQWGFSTGPFKSLFTQYNNPENFWTSSGDLKQAHKNTIDSRLRSNKNSNECQGFLNVMQIGFDVWATPDGDDPGDDTKLALWYMSVLGTGLAGPPRDVRIPTESYYHAGSRTRYRLYSTFTFWTPSVFFP